MLIRPPQLQFFEDGIKITATDTIVVSKNCPIIGEHVGII